MAIYAGVDNQLYYKYLHRSTNTVKWACPKKRLPASAQKTAVREIQTALKRAGYNPGAIDGLIGPKTCEAAYRYKRERLSEYDATLTRTF